ncbi:hypothetical protein PENDEC_c085G01229, partial [Penicillium decumbens]
RRVLLASTSSLLDSLSFWVWCDGWPQGPTPHSGRDVCCSCAPRLLVRAVISRLLVATYGARSVPLGRARGA